MAAANSRHQGIAEQRAYTLRRLVIVSCCKISHSIYVRLTGASKIHEALDYMRAAMQPCHVIHLTYVARRVRRQKSSRDDISQGEIMS